VSRYHTCDRCGRPGVESQYDVCGACAGKPFHRCVHCRGVITNGTVCASCVELLALHGGEGDRPRIKKADRKTDESTVKDSKSVFSSASSADSSPPHEHNGFWLYHAAVKRGVLDWFQSFGAAHGYPSNMTKWSRGMVSQAVQARKAVNRPTS
jgi:hypothetical protein